MADPTRTTGSGNFQELQNMWEEKFTPQQMTTNSTTDVQGVYQNTIKQVSPPPQLIQRGRSATAAPALISTTPKTERRESLRVKPISSSNSPLTQKVSEIVIESKIQGKSPPRPVRPFSPPTFTSNQTVSSESIEKKLHEDAEGCREAMKRIENVQTMMHTSSQNTDANGNFVLANSFKRQLEELKTFERRTIFEFHRSLYVSKNQLYTERVDAQEKVVKELSDKLCEFLSRMEILLQALESKNVEFKPLNEKKEELITYLKEFFGSLHSGMLQKSLKALPVDMHSNPTAVMRTFEEMEIYFKGAHQLTCGYIKLIGYSNIQVVKGKSSHRVSVKDRYGVESQLETTIILTSIPRELAQYIGLFKDLHQAADSLLEVRRQLNYPCLPEEKIIEGCASLDGLLKGLQESMNTRDSLYI